MSYEVELKARLQNPAQIEGEVAKRGTLVSDVTKEDVYFRRVGDTDWPPTTRYRVRRIGAAHVEVTFKEKVKRGLIDTSREHEFTITAPHTFYRFAMFTGYEPFLVKRKQSRTYRVGRINVELNEVEHLGPFTELEILCESPEEIEAAEAEIKQLMVTLGLSESDVEPRRYIDMIRQAHPVRYQFVDDPQRDWPFDEISD